MTANLSCSPAIHGALVTAPEFTELRLVGYQIVPALEAEPADIVELRRCTICGSTLGKELGVGARLAKAQIAGDTAMIARCWRALRRDPFTDYIDDSAIRSWIDAVEFEKLMGSRVERRGGVR